MVPSPAAVAIVASFDRGAPGSSPRMGACVYSGAWIGRRLSRRSDASLAGAARRFTLAGDAATG